MLCMFTGENDPARLTEAGKELAEARRLQPDLSHLSFCEGQLALRQRRWAEAEKAFATGFAGEPRKNADVAMCLGQAILKQTNTPSALERPCFSPWSSSLPTTAESPPCTPSLWPWTIEPTPPAGSSARAPDYRHRSGQDPASAGVAENRQRGERPGCYLAILGWSWRLLPPRTPL